ncbi:uncharacterized protein LOC126272965 isoform X2 [Schistocerca gregaria]|uniref:uncharacterized protein LOC126272965 isoform X2 n=1 Tax=Schistocerca gregaria TaxID=7010 RepID=UPI00211ECFAD|nr:uncharacterized protein LOC126272965 isoform X2 [Schistocerca gregaria]
MGKTASVLMNPVTTLLVLDDLRQRFPCAFLISNRKDAYVLELDMNHDVPVEHSHTIPDVQHSKTGLDTKNQFPVVEQPCTMLWQPPVQDDASVQSVMLWKQMGRT